MPLSFEPGLDAQVDWHPEGSRAVVKINGEQVQAQMFVMRLCYSRKIFVMAFPSQKQESFLAGHVAAFRHMEGVPRRIIYDNLKTAVHRILEGPGAPRARQEQTVFMEFRSHYLFESRFCNPSPSLQFGSGE